MLRAHPVVLALCVFGVGFALVWAGFSPLNDDPFQFCPDAPQAEGSSIRTEPALWPPGTTRCDYGSSSRIYVPWRDWLVLALLAAGVGAAAAKRFGHAAGVVAAAFVAAFL